MRVLVTGGAGYIGSFVVRHLLGQGHEARVLDNLSTGTGRAVPDVPLDVVDIRDADKVEAVLAAFSPEAVIHLAALKSSAESVRSPHLYYDVNVTGTAGMLRAALQHDVKRFVFSSSCAVYGNPQICPVDERTAPCPQSPYGETKLTGERMLGWYARSAGMRYASLRYFNVAGAAPDASLGEFTNESTSQLVPRVIDSALRGTNLEIYGTDYPTGDGTALRDYIHVEDLAAAHVQVLERLNSAEVCGEYNLGTGRPVSVQEVVEAIERRSGLPVPRQPRPRRAGDPMVSWADPALAHRVFGWSPERDFDEIVRSAWLWHTSGEQRRA
ncbi:UDP-glucose 4-epimerase GalE [Streptomyces sp. NBC_00893]|uniref:UDP-glucose 4-epimerase GalE n=1 Tax=Streptomyces sp. NBC_00893 TaxID=2975862 RepID=UPI002259DC9B|nr:UDP-glucose 4-epimerase GalE [Streptomyces sp. NBC_00893]MCX4850454.1 UDP-glucose 4-epimerase GalE [Streptomyces sp. NBC_00893]